MNTEIRDPQARWEDAATIIREKSRGGQLTPAEAIFDEASAAREEEMSEASREDALKELPRLMMEENKDIRAMFSRSSSGYYYSTLFMTERYAEMLLKKEDDPLRLVADLVRENAAQYPRPTPIDVLEGSPFDMSQEQILACLQDLAAREEYEDIERLSTSTGTVFLYSTLHLDPAHASMLAEWIDVGQFENP
jgi:hypothetical protein